MLAATGEPPAPADLIATLDRGDLGHRHIGGGHQHRAVFAPHIALGLNRVASQLPRVYADHAEDPGSGHAAFGQGHLNLEKGAQIDFMAAPHFRLQGAKQTGFLHVTNGFLGQLAILVRLG